MLYLVGVGGNQNLSARGALLRFSADSRYVESLVNIDGCAREPCQFEMGVFRDLPEARLRQEIGARLRQHMTKDRSGLK